MIYYNIQDRKPLLKRERKQASLLIDIIIILAYFAIVMTVGVYKRVTTRTSPEEYFLNSRSLRWPSIAISTIATNIHAGHFLGMAGSAYLFGLAQANLEINAITGILIAAFFFVPLCLKERITTTSEFFEIRLGRRVALTNSILMIILYSFVFVGSILFWGAYAINAIFDSSIQIILQRAIAAKNLFHAQVGLIVGGFLKYLMAAIVILPAIALAGILINNPLEDPDLAYTTIVNKLIPVGLKGLILCGLFASLMSSVDSIFHSVSTLWSIDIYKKYINPNADGHAVVKFGRASIFLTLITGIMFAWINIYDSVDLVRF